jgi:hypothetical protein
LRRNPGATLIGILVMAIGIGANTAVFSVVHAVLLNPLPYSEPQRIVALTYRSSDSGGSNERSRQVSLPDFRDWQRDSASFDAMAYYTVSPTSVIAGSVADYAVVATVAEDFLRVFAAQPSIGRPFTHDEAKEGGAAGVYGVMAYVAGQRSKEIGVRMALGASAGSVLWLMLARGLKLAAVGLAAGVLGAIASTRLIAGMLFEVQPYDALTYIGVVVALGLLSLLATYVPARRATRIDPLNVLRQE